MKRTLSVRRPVRTVVAHLNTLQPMNPVRIYDYLVKARDKVFDAVRPLAPEHWLRDFPIGLRTLGSTLTHVMIVEWSYVQRMQNIPLPPYDQWPIQDEKPPAFDVIERTWREQATQTRRVVESLYSDPDGRGGWMREFEYISQSREGRRTAIIVSPADLFTQLLVHEVHHRSQVMAMVRMSGAAGGQPLENLDFGYFMFSRRFLT